MRLDARSLLIGATLASLLAAGCSSSDSNPAQATVPSPAPTAQPTPTPTPTPEPTGPGVTASCQALPPGAGSDANCRNEGAKYGNELELAMAAVHPEYLDGNKVLNISGYLKDLVDAFDAQGICAVPEADNLFVRHPNDSFNDYFDILTSTGDRARRYTNTCNPAVPTPELPPPPAVKEPTCSLPPSRSLVCQREDPLWASEVQAAIEVVIEEDRARTPPVLFDFEQRLAGVPNGYKVLDIEGYHKAVSEKLRARDFCVHFDREDIVLKKSNWFSEHWDIYKAEGFVIQLYAGICRDADY